MNTYRVYFHTLDLLKPSKENRAMNKGTDRKRRNKKKKPRQSRSENRNHFGYVILRWGNILIRMRIIRFLPRKRPYGTVSTGVRTLSPEERRTVRVKSVISSNGTNFTHQGHHERLKKTKSLKNADGSRRESTFVAITCETSGTIRSWITSGTRKTLVGERTW